MPVEITKMPAPPTPEQLIQTHNILALMPEIALTLSALVVLLAGAFFGDLAQRRLLPTLTILGAIATAFITANLWDKNLLFGPENTAMYSADNFALFFKFLFLIGLAVTTLISQRFLSPRTGDAHVVSGEYYTLLMLSTVGMMMVAAARDLLVVFLGIETLSIALYILAGFARRRLVSNEAALKYFLLGAFASGFLLYGIALMYFAAGSTSLPKIALFAASPGAAVSPLGSLGGAAFYLGVAFLIIGLGFKAALVPFHQWTPDVYEGAPTPVTAFMATGAKAAAFAALIRVLPDTLGAPQVAAHWHHLILVIAVLTMTVGNVVAIAQNSLKRMLAYSSVAHAGYLLVGVLAAGSAMRNANIAGMTEAAARAKSGVLFYLLVYALMNLGAFAVLVYLENRRAAMLENRNNAEFDTEDANLSIEDLRGLAAREPLAAAALTIFLLSLAGIPPTAGFFGKFSIFLEAMQQGLVGLLIVGVLNSVISVFYYLRPVLAMYNADELAAPSGASEIVAAPDGAASLSTSRAASLGVVLAIVLCAIGVLGMIALQYALMPFVQSAAGLNIQ
jgi:NADH-quinone oxidoreductase subunit N